MGNPSPRFTPLKVAANITDFQTLLSKEAAGIHALPSSSKAHSSFEALSNSPRENGTCSSIVSLLVLSKEPEADIESGPVYTGSNCFKMAMAEGCVGTSSNVTAHFAIAESAVEGIASSSDTTLFSKDCSTKTEFDDCTWRIWKVWLLVHNTAFAGARFEPSEGLSASDFNAKLSNVLA